MFKLTLRYARYALSTFATVGFGSNLYTQLAHTPTRVRWADRAHHAGSPFDCGYDWNHRCSSPP